MARDALSEPLMSSKRVETTPTWKPRLDTKQIVGTCLSALVMVVNDCAVAVVVFHSLPEHLTRGLTIVLIAGSVTPTLLLGATKSELVAPWTVDAFVASVFAQSAASIASHEDTAPFTTFCAAMTMTTFIIGAVYACLGLLRAGRLVQFVPSPVMSGFLGSMGPPSTSPDLTRMDGILGSMGWTPPLAPVPSLPLHQCLPPTASPVPTAHRARDTLCALCRLDHHPWPLLPRYGRLDRHLISSHLISSHLPRGRLDPARRHVSHHHLVRRHRLRLPRCPQ
jgi:hypothetical protein